MKSKKDQVKTSRREKIGDWAKGVGIVSLVAAFAAGTLDLFVVTPGHATVPFVGYLLVIGAGVALQFVGSAVPNMRFTSRSKTQPKEVHRIDS